MSDIQIVSVDRWRNDDPDGRVPAGTIWLDVDSDIEQEPHAGITIEQMVDGSEPAKYWK
jgi:hypothetical protein